MNIEHRISAMKDMMKSCFTYGKLDKSTYNFERYIKPFEEQLGEDLFNEIYEEHSKYLADNFEIKQNVYTDSEGLTYNQLIKKQ